MPASAFDVGHSSASPSCSMASVRRQDLRLLVGLESLIEQLADEMSDLGHVQTELRCYSFIEIVDRVWPTSCSRLVQWFSK